MSSVQRIGMHLLVAGMVAATVSGCGKDAIYVSNAVLDFQRNPFPLQLMVANDHADFESLTITLEPSVPWILLEPNVVVSKAPDNGKRDEQVVTVRIDRTQLRTVGAHEGEITLSASGAKPVVVQISVYQETVLPQGGLLVVNPVVTYSAPYLIEFAFALQDASGHSVVGEPNQFTLSAFEDESSVGVLNGLAMQRGAARQLWMELVLDYSLVMQQMEGAIAGMEKAASEILLKSLNNDALTAVSEFHRDDQDSNLVIPFNVDKVETAAQIAGIQKKYVRGFASGARMYDALIHAAKRFPNASVGAKDERYIVLFSNGQDTSSTALASQAAAEAKARNIRIIAISFGASADSGTLMSLATLTGGMYIHAKDVAELQPAVQQIVSDLDGQYVVRWASLRRNNTPVTPSFGIGYGSATVNYKAEKKFRATDYSGDALEGKLVLVQSDALDRSTVFLRTKYMPRGIDAIHLWTKGDPAFSASLVSAADDGLLGGWNIRLEPELDGTWLIMESNGAAVPFAAFGPMVRFDFNSVIDVPFTEIYCDNAIYTEGQSLIFEQP